MNVWARTHGVVLGVLLPLDRVRARALRLLAPVTLPLVRDRTARVMAIGVVSVVSALVLTAWAPLALLALGPILLGVPHLVSDARYLVVRQGLHMRPRFWYFVGPGVCLTVLQPTSAWGCFAVLGACIAARAPLRAKLVPMLACLLVASASQQLGARADALFAHAHNLIAIVAWVLWARSARGVLVVLATFLLSAALILGGLVDPIVLELHALAPSPLSVSANDAISSLSPVRDPRWSLRAMLFFAFAQSVHYAIWLRLIPEEDRRRPTIRTFSASYRALAADLSLRGLLVVLLLMLGIVLPAFLSLDGARSSYLRLALFHGPLELAVFLLLWLEKQPLQRAT